MAVLAALYAPARRAGCEIDISMVESMTRFMAPRLVPYLGSGELTRRSGGRDSVIAVYQIFDTADEPMTLGLGNDAHLEALLGGGRRAGVGADERLSYQ